jgi:uncharacterized membrane protein
MKHQFPFRTWDSVIVSHTIAAVGTIGLGALVLRMPSGTKTHRRLGRLWAGTMLFTSVSSFGITGLRDQLSFIHGLSVYVIYSVCAGVYHIRRGDVARHRWHMKGSFAITVASGAFALFMPGRRLYNLAFGVPPWLVNPHDKA